MMDGMDGMDGKASTAVMSGELIMRRLARKLGLLCASPSTSRYVLHDPTRRSLLYV